MTRWRPAGAMMAGILLVSACVRAESDGDITDSGNVLWYRTTAHRWEDQALPIGNGRIGGMIYGGIQREHIQFNEDSLWVGDETNTGRYQAFGDIYVELEGTRTTGGVSALRRYATPITEDIEKSHDGEATSKWCIEHGGKPIIWQVTLPHRVAEPLISYTLTSAIDQPRCDPQSWQLLGSNDDNEWVMLDRRKLDGPFPARPDRLWTEGRLTNQTFECTNRTPFRCYRFVFEPTHPTHFQVGDIALGEPNTPLRMAAGSATTAGYLRWLDIGRAVHQIRYTQGQTTYRRTCFASHPAQVMVMRFEADTKAAYSGRIVLTDAYEAKIVAEGNRITSTGTRAGYVDRATRKPVTYKIGLDYEAQIVVLNEGGTVEARDGCIVFQRCDALTLLLAAGTDYVNQRQRGWKGEHPHRRLLAQLEAAAAKPYESLLNEHVADYQSLFNRLSIDLGPTPEAVRRLPTDERLFAYQKSPNDVGLEALFFDYARYLMISSSRPGDLPANLQGLWNMTNRPRWRGDYHTDVNVEMNYWFVDPCNMAECFLPLAEWVNSIREVRREETHAAFGTRGWITHAENGIFGGSTFRWSKGDAAWVGQNLWDHYAFTRDREYLRTRAYPILKELCEFWVDHLKRLPDGTLVAPMDVSPEWGPEEDGISYDQQLVWDLFTNYAEASETLGVDGPFRAQVASMRQLLLGPRIGKWGQLQEWKVDRDDPKAQFRHLSHLIAVYPGRQIAPAIAPELAEAAKVSLNARGDESTGWSRAWKIALWARLRDGNRSHKLLAGLVQSEIRPNLFDVAPPFQIDANFGYAAGVCEMLVQSHLGRIELLPALPDAWPTGSVRGMRVRGGVEIDLAWQDRRATSAVLRASVDGRHSLCAPKGQTIDGPDTVELKAGQTYSVTFRSG